MTVLFPDEPCRNGTITIARLQDAKGDWNIVAVDIDGEPATIADALRIMGSARSVTTVALSTIAGTGARRVEYAYEV